MGIRLLGISIGALETIWYTHDPNPSTPAVLGMLAMTFLAIGMVFGRFSND